MGSAIRTFEIERGYRIEAVSRARSGRSVSGTLLAARQLISTRGWAPRSVKGEGSASRGPVDVLTAVRIAWAGHPNARLDLMDYYALLAPIAFTVGSSFTAWEQLPDLEASDVLAMFDDAIAFAAQAEQPSPDILAAVAFRVN